MVERVSPLSSCPHVLIQSSYEDIHITGLSLLLVVMSQGVRSRRRFSHVKSFPLRYLFGAYMYVTLLLLWAYPAELKYS